ncbi:MAG: hypothetical protein AAF409_00480 [Pseudomonadota bacterium]
MQTATEVDVLGRSFLVGHSPDKTFALVDYSQAGQVNGYSLEVAVARSTDCDAVFEGGVLKFVPGITNMSRLPIRGSGNIRVETYCEGDTRRRKTGLPDGRPGTDEQAARFAAYPQVGQTYLSFNRQHGFQISYVETSTRSWLWYPGNTRSLPESWEIRGSEICFRHPENTFNPATKQSGGNFSCQPLDLSQRMTVAELEGDAFGLAVGTVPYRRLKCDAPLEFSFDRSAIGC